MFADELKTLKRLGWRYVALQVLNFAQVIASGLMLWKGLGLLCNTESPIVVVLSGSMEPAFHRGDILFLTNPRSSGPEARYATGDITVYKLPQGGIPIVHRVIEARDVRGTECPELVSVDASSAASASSPFSKGKLADGVDVEKGEAEAEVLGVGKAASSPMREACRQLLLTKGDNNPQDDIALYGYQLKWLERRHIVGKVRGFLPYVGYVTIAMNDFPQLKYALLGGLGFLALVSRE